MYFTHTPSLNSMEAIMQKPPGGAQRGGGRNRSPYKWKMKRIFGSECLKVRISKLCSYNEGKM